MQLLPNTHTSPETAYLVNDYPFGFRLRCKIRYWIEYKPNKGFRFCSQTTDPRRANEVWNKPKHGTYCLLGMALYLDDNNHVQHAALTEYADLAEATKFMDTYGSAVPHMGVAALYHYLKLKTIYERIRREEPELHYQLAAIKASKELHNEPKKT